MPISAHDTSLIVFAQLTACRLNVARSLVSLLDHENQYVLAESTQTQVVHSGRNTSLEENAFLGSAVMPRNKGICEVVLDRSRTLKPPHPDTPVEESVIVIDLPQTPRYASQPYVRAAPFMKTYIGVPIKTADGTVIGALCAFDDKPPRELTHQDAVFLHDMTRTIMLHIDDIRLRFEHARRSQLVNGLESFVRGLSHVKQRAKSSYDQRPSDFAESSSEDEIARERTDPVSTALPNGHQSMFRKAARIIRQSGDYDGVVFCYVPSSVVPFTRSEAVSYDEKDISSGRSTESNEATRDVTDTLSDENSLTTDLEAQASTRPGSRASREATNKTHKVSLLAMSTAQHSRSRVSSALRKVDLTTQDLGLVLGRKPTGKTFSAIDLNGFLDSSSGNSALSGAEQSDGKLELTAANDVSAKILKSRKVRLDRQIKGFEALRKLASDAQAFVVLPLWDLVRERVVTACICWSKSEYRDLKADGDLHVLRVFGDSIMNKLAHLDALEADRAKTAIVSSISHELRSPLHGILAATDFLTESDIDGFQQELVDSVATCGRTLLDTVEHIMDFAKITSHRNTRKIATAYPGRDYADVCSLVEEVAEAVAIGYSAVNDILPAGRDHEYSGDGVTPARPEAQHRRKCLRLALDIPHYPTPFYQISSGALRRVVMNLFGNAIKYTDTGYVSVRIEIKSNTATSKDPQLVLTIMDSGRGMSNRFMQDHLFRPFTQEDPLATGVGLGMNIVKQIVHKMKGDIHVASVPNEGTQIDVHLPVPAAPEEFSGNKTERSVKELLDSVRKRLRDKRIVIVHNTAVSEDAAQTASQSVFAQALMNTMLEWFDVTAALSDSRYIEAADIVMYLEPSFSGLQSIREINKHTRGTDKPAAVIFIVYDAIELAAIRADARVLDQTSVVEAVMQPMGPTKLAKTLLRCLERQMEPTSDSDSMSPAMSLPTPSSERGDPLSHAALAFRRRRSYRKESSSTIRVQASAETEGRNSGPGPRILIVDDNHINLRLLSNLLQKRGYPYETATDGKAAVQKFKELAGQISCVLMDISMPVMDGMTATRQIRTYERSRNLTRTPIVALTGLASYTARVEADEAGMDHFMTKPVSFSDLAAYLDKTLVPNSSMDSTTTHAPAQLSA